MSLIHCTCACVYQNEGYCELEKAAEISIGPNYTDCLHYKAKKPDGSNSENKVKTEGR